MSFPCSIGQIPLEMMDWVVDLKGNGSSEIPSTAASR